MAKNILKFKFKVQSDIQAKESSKRGPAKFLPEYKSGHKWIELQQEGLNKAMKSGKILKHSESTYHLYVDMGRPVGFYNGKAASHLRIEITTSGADKAVHCHPVNETDSKLTKFNKLFGK